MCKYDLETAADKYPGLTHALSTASRDRLAELCMDLITYIGRPAPELIVSFILECCLSEDSLAERLERQEKRCARLLEENERLSDQPGGECA